MEDIMNIKNMKLALAVGLALASASCAMDGQQGGGNPMSFFVTSAGPGKGADLGGIAGADRHCQSLAQSVGAGNKTWRAYLSTSGAQAVNARDRIGRGPWQNAKGVVVARDVNDLHSANNQLSKQNSITEKGEVISGRGDPVNMHDILTGSTADGRAMSADKDMTCSNWTSSSAGSAMLGHHDRIGLTEDPPAKSWNASHPSKGCSQDNLKSTGGAGLVYCFAAN
jgi:hypothetical protein